MFYSHEILTSPEHGVATVWLVATLGSKSVTRKLNKKAILDVDVPKTCGVIMDPVAPMALRLQGNLLYGVSRVYSQQCGYTLTDVQAMHDRMRALLKVLPGGGLDPMAGKARPDQLILPYDASFLPENNLPGLGLDFTSLNLSLDLDLSQQPNRVWPQTPDLSQSALSQTDSLKLDLSSNRSFGDIDGFSAGTSVSRYGGIGIDFGGFEPLQLGEESGVILQPDFEFDEDGNIIELAGSVQPETRLQGNMAAMKERAADAMEVDVTENFVMEDQSALLDEGPKTELPDLKPKTESVDIHKTTQHRASIFDQAVDEEDTVESNMALQQKRSPKLIGLDDQIALRNTEMAQLNSNYVQNMAAASKQKQRNKLPTLAKKRAAFWVFGQGIGSVGVGVGLSQVTHPLHSFSGKQLYEKLLDQSNGRVRKRVHPSIEGGDPDLDTRRVRPRVEDEDQIGRHDDRLWNEDVEIGRNAPPSLRDDHSIQMPWNITASVQSSRQGSSAANIFRGFGSASDFSSHGISDTGFGRARSRLTSASPLAGRGFPFDAEALNVLSIPGNELGELDNLDDFDISQYLHTELATEHGGAFEDQIMGAGHETHSVVQGLQVLNDKSQKSTLDQESFNFLKYLESIFMTATPANEEEVYDPNGPAGEIKSVTFSTLLPPQKTSHIVATQGLMHVLTLATRGILSVHQEAYEDQSTEEYGVRYKYGEIHLCIPGLSEATAAQH
ncbi:R8 protein [Aspergillus tubingensis]